MSERLFTDDELVELTMPYRDRVAAAIEQVVEAGRRSNGDGPGAADALAALVADIERQQQRFVAGFHQFVAAIQEWLVLRAQSAETTPIEVLTALDRHLHESSLVDITTYGAPSPDIDADGITEIVARALSGDADGALAELDRWQADLLRRHDLAVDRVAAALTFVYREMGVDELEACLRHCGARTLLAWMPHDLARPLDVRIRHWVRLGLANFATLRAEETDDEIVLVQDPCGTCSRQVLQGAYGPPLDFAVVTEPHPITWQRGDTPVYRTHVAVMHDLMPREAIGEPWPRIECPAGVTAGPCRQRFPKR